MTRIDDKPFQFSLRFIFFLTFLISAELAVVATLGRLAVALLLPTFVAADLCRRESRRSFRRGDKEKALFWFAVALTLVLLAIGAAVVADRMATGA